MILPPDFASLLTSASQRFEQKADEVELVGDCSGSEYPLQKKRHTLEFLRSIAHLRPRTNTIASVARVRNALAYATHQFFQEKGFFYINVRAKPFSIALHLKVAVH